ncbi:MAG: radical SAM protein, partial [archaeon]
MENREEYNVNMTWECNCNCTYCYTPSKDKRRLWEDIKKDIDQNILKIAKEKNKKYWLISILGGEPLTNFPLLKKICNYILLSGV